MAIIKGTKENFEAEVLNANGVVVVDFGANWCGPCKSLVPILDEVVFRNGEIIDKSIGLIQKHEVKALFAK